MGEWVHVAAVWDYGARTLRLHVGDVVGTWEDVDGMDTNALSANERSQRLLEHPTDAERDPERYVLIGASSLEGHGSLGWVGLDDLRVYSGALSPEAFAALRESGGGTPRSSAMWRRLLRSPTRSSSGNPTRTRRRPRTATSGRGDGRGLPRDAAARVGLLRPLHVGPEQGAGADHRPAARLQGRRRSTPIGAASPARRGPGARRGRPLLAPPKSGGSPSTSSSTGTLGASGPDRQVGGSPVCARHPWPIPG